MPPTRFARNDTVFAKMRAGDKGAFLATITDVTADKQHRRGYTIRFEDDTTLSIPNYDVPYTLFKEKDVREGGFERCDVGGCEGYEVGEGFLGRWSREEVIAETELSEFTYVIGEKVKCRERGDAGWWNAEILEVEETDGGLLRYCIVYASEKGCQDKSHWIEPREVKHLMKKAARKNSKGKRRRKHAARRNASLPSTSNRHLPSTELDDHSSDEEMDVLNDAPNSGDQLIVFHDHDYCNNAMEVDADNAEDGERQEPASHPIEHPSGSTNRTSIRLHHALFKHDPQATAPILKVVAKKLARGGIECGAPASTVQPPPLEVVPSSSSTSSSSCSKSSHNEAVYHSSTLDPLNEPSLSTQPSTALNPLSLPSPSTHHLNRAPISSFPHSPPASSASAQPPSPTDRSVTPASPSTPTSPSNGPTHGNGETVDDPMEQDGLAGSTIPTTDRAYSSSTLSLQEDDPVKRDNGESKTTLSSASPIDPCSSSPHEPCSSSTLQINEDDIEMCDRPIMPRFHFPPRPPYRPCAPAARSPPDLCLSPRSLAASNQFYYLNSPSSGSESSYCEVLDALDEISNGNYIYPHTDSDAMKANFLEQMSVMKVTFDSMWMQMRRMETDKADHQRNMIKQEKKKNARIAQLEDDLKCSKEKEIDASKTIEKKNARIAQLEEELKCSNEKEIEKSESLEESKKRMDQMEKENGESNKILEDERKKNEAKEAQITKLESAKEQLVEELEKEAKDNKLMKTRLESLEKEKAESSGILEEERNKSEEMKTRLDILEKEKAESSGLLEEERNKNEEMKTRLDNLEKEKAESSGLLEEGRKKSEEMKRKLEELEKDKEELKGTLDKERMSNKEKDEELSVLRKQMDDFRNKFIEKTKKDRNYAKVNAKKEGKPSDDKKIYMPKKGPKNEQEYTEADRKKREEQILRTNATFIEDTAPMRDDDAIPLHERATQIQKSDVEFEAFSDSECKAFEDFFADQNNPKKNFSAIKEKCLPSRSVGDLLQHYYGWKGPQNGVYICHAKDKSAQFDLIAQGLVVFGSRKRTVTEKAIEQVAGKSTSKRRKKDEASVPSGSSVQSESPREKDSQ